MISARALMPGKLRRREACATVFEWGRTHADPPLGRECRFSATGALRDAARRERLLRASGSVVVFKAQFTLTLRRAFLLGPSRRASMSFIDTPWQGEQEGVCQQGGQSPRTSTNTNPLSTLRPFNLRPFNSSTVLRQFLQQLLRLLQRTRVESFREPSVDFGQERPGVAFLALLPPQARKAHDGL